MSIISKALIGSAAVAMSLAAAAPAAAQYYPQQQQQPYGNSGGVIGAIINSVTGGYGQYPQGNYGYGQTGQRAAVAQCAAAAEQRLNGGYRGQGYGGYNGNGYQNGYQNSHGYQTSQGARVVGITNVERRGNGGLRVTGLASSAGHENEHQSSGAQGYGQGYGAQGYDPRYGNQGYGNQSYGGQGSHQANLRFTCRVNARGQVTDVNINRLQTAYNRGY